MRRKGREPGHLYRRNGWWVLRFRQTFCMAGEMVVKQRAVQLVPVSERFKTRKAVQTDAIVKEQIAGILTPLKQQKPEMILTLVRFVEEVYLPHIKAAKKPSTFRGYQDMWQDHIRLVVKETQLLAEVRTSDVQNWLQQIFAQHRTADGNPLSKLSLRHLKALLSGIFRYAARMDYLDSGKANPVREVDLQDIPAAEGNVTHAYSLPQIRQMLFVLPEPARTMVATAAYSGVRRGELQGLCWEDWQNGTLTVTQSYWQGKQSTPKTRASKAAIPVLRTLARILQEHRQRLGNPTSGPMFPAANGKPIDPNNVLCRQIKPILMRCGVCHKGKAEHLGADHDYQRDGLPEWHGWHAFRRGLATNLHSLKIDDITIQAILRHEDVAVTQECYIKAVPEQSVAAMDTLENALESSLCAERALEATFSTPATVN